MFNTTGNSKTYLQSGLFRVVQLAVVLAFGYAALTAYDYVSNVFSTVETTLEETRP